MDGLFFNRMVCAVDPHSLNEQKMALLALGSFVDLASDKEESPRIWDTVRAYS